LLSFERTTNKAEYHYYLLQGGIQSQCFTTVHISATGGNRLPFPVLLVADGSRRQVMTTEPWPTDPARVGLQNFFLTCRPAIPNPACGLIHVNRMVPRPRYHVAVSATGKSRRPVYGVPSNAGHNSLTEVLGAPQDIGSRSMIVRMAWVSLPAMRPP
jgi:hypothetical protein